MITDEAWFRALLDKTNYPMDQIPVSRAKVVEDFGVRCVKVVGGNYNVSETRALAYQLTVLADEAEKNPEVEDLAGLLSAWDLNRDSMSEDASWHEIAEAVINAGYRKQDDEK